MRLIGAQLICLSDIDGQTEIAMTRREH